MQSRQFDPFFYRLFVLTTLGVFLYVIYRLNMVIVPFLVAFVLAYLLNPMVTKLHKMLRIRRWLAILLVYFGVGFGVLVALWWLIPLVWEQAQSFWLSVPSMIDWYNNTARGWVRQNFSIKMPTVTLKYWSTGLLEYAQQHYSANDAKSLFDKLFLQGMNIANVFGMLVLIPILTFYFVYNWDERLRFWKNAVPRPYLQKVSQIAKESDEALMSFVKGQFLVMVLLGIVYAVQLQLIGLKVGLIIGMAAGIASFVPYLGFIIGFVAAIIAGFFQFGLDWVKFGMIVGAFMVGQAVEGYILQPLLLGDKIGLSPLWVIFSVLAGASLMGITGMLIALPVAAVLNVFARHVFQWYIRSDYYKNNHNTKSHQQHVLIVNDVANNPVNNSANNPDS
ncbi:PerM family permease [Moraxella macacae 0408225]|uniref:PerM family permease n=1 Tax=Moraxella macacae 0408225 TaxID=1230338 RepID=L2F6Y8_9GAMM|nr:AI-2E family transporter [Moraxella macacae]ELA08844.1 PerM family permease [Moraxella macacae 0408225]